MPNPIKHDKIIGKLLDFEHRKVAVRLGFITDTSEIIDTDLLYNTIGVIDDLSRQNDEDSKRKTITLCAILWTYRNEDWDGLKDFIILVLSRIGFATSAIMVDEAYDSINMEFSSLNSIMNQFLITCYHIKYEVNIGDKTFLLTKFQKKIWDKIDHYNLLGISAPTSAGKSFIILIKCIEAIINNPRNIVYIVPTLSLVSQVATDFKKYLIEFNIPNFEILTSFYDRPENNYAIYILTQEKAIAAFSQKELPFTDLRFFIVDEIQNVERVAEEDEQRAKTLYDVLMEFRHASKPNKTIISGPRIESIGELGTTIFGTSSQEEKTNGSPVVNFTYAISKIGKAYYFKQYSDIREDPSSIFILQSQLIDGHGKVQYRKGFHLYLSYVIKCLGRKSNNIIFAPTARQARKTALALSELKLDKKDDTSSLVEFISNTVHPKYALCETLRNGVAYHHGKTPMHIRKAVERAISENMIRNIVCTTTLMQGVNLPAQNVIIRNPNLYVNTRYGKPTLTNYEIANLRGRAGRLLKDFIGRTFVLDENSFENSIEQAELFSESSKELNPGYGEKFNEYQDLIMDDLYNLVPFSESGHDYSFLLTYIRQVAIKYNNRGLTRLHTVGIDITNEEYVNILNTLNKLDVSKDICMKNRYWDPIDLNTLYKRIGEFIIPQSINEKGISKKLFKLIKIIYEILPIYGKRYFLDNVDKDNILMMHCINTESWLKEVPLKSILNKAYFDDSDKIERTISDLQNKTSFGLPMLFKPLYDMNQSESMFLRFIELGAFNPFTRRMIEMNIPREISIMLNEKYFEKLNHDVENLDGLIIDKLRSIKEDLSYWNKIQIETVA